MLAKTMTRLRERTRLSQREFAKLIGVSLATVKAWEGGRFHSLSTESQHKVREALGLTPEQVVELFFNQVPPRHEPRERLGAQSGAHHRPHPRPKATGSGRSS